MMPAWSIMALCGIVVVGVLALAFQQDAKRKRFVARLAKALGASRDGHSMTATFQGTAYRVAQVPASRYRPSSLTVRIAAHVPGWFEVVRSAAGDKLSFGIGLTHQIRSGDPEFDAAHCVTSNDESFATACVRLQESRSAIRALFGLGVTHVTYDGTAVEAVWSPFQPDDTFDPTRISKAVASLAAIAQAAPVVARPTGMKPPVRWKHLEAVVHIALAALFIGGSIGGALATVWFPPLDQERLFVDSLKYSVVAVGLFLAMLVRLMAGEARALRRVTALLVLSLLGFVMTGFSTELFLNGWLDRAPGTVHVAEVISRHAISGRHGRRYHLHIASWREAHAAERLRVSAALYQRSIPHQTSLSVRTRPGRFGFEWVASMALIPTEAIAVSEFGSMAEALAHARQLQQAGQRDEAVKIAQAVMTYAEEEARLQQAQALLDELGAPLPAPSATGEAATEFLPEIVIVPIGAINHTVLDEAIRPVQAMLGIRFTIAPDGFAPGATDRTTRLAPAGQVNAERLLDELQTRHATRSPVVLGYLGLTGQDLFSGKLNYVFGSARPGYGMVSYHRFLAATYGDPENRPLLRTRLVKQLVSTTFFILGIRRCTTRGCIRAYPNSVEAHDLKGTALCDWCRGQLSTRLQRETLSRRVSP